MTTFSLCDETLYLESRSHKIESFRHKKLDYSQVIYNRDHIHDKAIHLNNEFPI